MATNCIFFHVRLNKPFKPRLLFTKSFVLKYKHNNEAGKEREFVPPRTHLRSLNPRPGVGS